jgi:hypothetical protein
MNTARCLYITFGLYQKGPDAAMMSFFYEYCSMPLHNLCT